MGEVISEIIFSDSEKLGSRSSPDEPTRVSPLLGLSFPLYEMGLQRCEQSSDALKTVNTVPAWPMRCLANSSPAAAEVAILAFPAPPLTVCMTAECRVGRILLLTLVDADCPVKEGEWWPAPFPTLFPQLEKYSCLAAVNLLCSADQVHCRAV